MNPSQRAVSLPPTPQFLVYRLLMALNIFYLPLLLYEAISRTSMTLIIGSFFMEHQFSDQCLISKLSFILKSTYFSLIKQR